jgi:hypothetical protein
MTFSITGVDQSGIEGIFANPLPGTDLGSLVGKPVAFARKVVGQVTRLYRDAVGPLVVKVALDDMNALRLAATGCLTAINVDGSGVELRDRVEDHGSVFQYTKATGEKLCKRFTGLSEFERDAALLAKHCAKIQREHPNANESFAELLVKGTEMAPRNWRKAGKDSRSTWPNGNSIGTAREIIPNKNASAR